MLVPKLRFKEFNNNWNNEKISNAFALSSGSTPNTKQRFFYTGNINWVSSGELKRKYIVDTINKVSNIAIEKNNLKIYDIGTLLIAIYGLEASGVRGTCSILNIKATISQACMALESKNNISNEFMYYWYQKNGQWIGLRIAQGTKQQNLTAELIGNLEVEYPSIDEQEKIVNFLSLLDKKIELQKQKIEALKIYKTGVCQKLFQSIKDDKTTFKMQISKFLKERKIYSEKGLEYPHVTLSKDGILDKSDRYNRDFLVMSNNKEYKITLLNDLCYNPANLKFGVICINEYGSAIFSPIYVTLEINPNIMDVSFCKYYFTRINFINKVRKYEQGTVYERMSVNVEDFLKHTDVFPCLENQRKIAKILSNLDRKINLQKNTLNNLNILKKSLLQQMFI